MWSEVGNRGIAGELEHVEGAVIPATLSPALIHLRGTASSFSNEYPPIVRIARLIAATR